MDVCNIALGSHNITMDTFYQTPIMPNTQGENGNAILTSERLNNLDALSETLKGLTINNVEYYESDKNDAKGDPSRDPKEDTHTSDGKKRKVTDTSNRNLQQKLLSNWTLLIITTTIDPQIPDGFATCGGIPYALSKPTTKGVVIDVTRSSAQQRAHSPDSWVRKQDGQGRHHSMRQRHC